MYAIHPWFADNAGIVQVALDWLWEILEHLGCYQVFMPRFFFVWHQLSFSV
jgi:hypothetical protein